jgi:hypothetical protein
MSSVTIIAIIDHRQHWSRGQATKRAPPQAQLQSSCDARASRSRQEAASIFRLLGCTSTAQHFQYKRAKKGAVYRLNLAKFHPKI